ncbi:MAG: hypothetical protein ABSF95_06410 [Verrucomicrobiota bacterium]|jgi:hypothetical protein
MTSNQADKTMNLNPMKTQNVNQHSTMPQGVLRALAGFAMVAVICSAAVAPAQDLMINTFDSAISGIDWENFRSYAYSCAQAWDASQDANGNPNSGSMYLTVNWPTNSDPNWNESWNDVQVAFYTGAFDSSAYITYDIDIKVDVTNSFTALDGTYGAVELIVNNPWTSVVGWAPLMATNGWQHIQGYFSGVPSGSYSEAVVGFISNGGSSLTNTVSYWIDNVKFTAPPSVNTNRPALSLAKAPPAGLTCICSQAGGTWQRQMIATVNSDYSWNTATAASNTTTYSMNIGAFPGANYPGFASQMFLIPKAGMAGSPIDDSIDWDSADVAALYVVENLDQTATGSFQYKVNQPSSWNASLTVSKVCTAGPLGTWSLTFNNNTNVTVTAPDNTSTNFTIPASDASLFQDPLFVYVGDQPNNNANIGQSSTFSRVKITGAAKSIDDDFVSAGTPGQPYVLDATTWAKNTADPLGVIITAPDAKYWVTWRTPDGGFTNLYATENLTNKLGSSQWLSLPTAATGWISVGAAERLAVINQSTLNTAFGHPPANCFFGLYHP